MRREEGPARNKMYNPPIAIPDSPGTALPVRPPIVVPFTFNSDMGLGGVKDKSIVGLRMLYGAAIASSISALADDALEASTVLRAVFGEERRLLLLVDEIIEALTAQLNDKGVSIGSAAAVASIGELLTEDGKTDVVLSSLTLPFVRELLGSKRQVQYVTINPLLYSDLRLGRKLGSGKVGQYTAKLLQSTYLLCSGYPRGVERLVRSYNDEESVELFSYMLEAKTEFKLSPEELAKVKVLYYQWGYKLRVAKEALKKQERLRAIRIAEVFVDQHFAENFHIVSGGDIKNCLLLVLVPIPRLVNAVELPIA
eukprot:gene27358-33045_t